MVAPNEPRDNALKRKLAEGSAIRDSKVPHAGIEHRPMPRSSVCNCRCCHLQPNLADTCYNYLNSGLPHRIMFYNRGEWSDFPEPVRQSLIEGFRDDKSCITVMLNDKCFLVDFLSMVLVNLSTSKQRSVAWIDESGKCFFPALFFDDESDESPELGSGIMNSSTLQKPMLARAFCPPTEVVKRVVMETGTSVLHQCLTSEKLHSNIETLERDSESFLFVQNLFLLGMGPFATRQSILQIHRYVPKDPSVQMRLEAFQRQIQSTRGQRGDANVRYGWFGSKKLDIARILIRGFGIGGKPTEGVLGTGVYLTPENCAFVSVNLCDVDEKGVQCLLLCRAILGNMEQVQPGSRQCFPCSNDYDSGVDDRSSPTCHVVWSTHLGNYIHPEYVVSFTLTPNIREYLFGLKDIRFHAAAPKAVQDFSSLHPIRCEPTKGPNSPWMPLTVLFYEIQNHISPLAKELLFHHYEELKSKSITREELVKKMKVIVGDELLMSTLARVQRSPASWYNNSTAQMKPVDSARRTSKTNGSATPTLELNESCALNMAPSGCAASNMASTVSATMNLSPIDCAASKMASTVAATMNLETDDSAASNKKPVDTAKLNMEPNDFVAPVVVPTDSAALNMDTNHSAAPKIAPTGSATQNMEPANLASTNVEPDDSAAADMGPPDSAPLKMMGTESASANKATTDSAAEKMVDINSATPMTLAADFSASKTISTDSAAQKIVPNEFPILTIALNESAEPEMGPNGSDGPKVAPYESSAAKIGPNDAAVRYMAPNDSVEARMGTTGVVTPRLEPKNSSFTENGS